MSHFPISVPLDFPGNIVQVKSRIPALPGKSLFAMNRRFNKMHPAGFPHHPDGPAEAIIDITSGQPAFIPEEYIETNRAVALMFPNHGDKVDQAGLQCFHKAMGIKSRIS